MLRRPRPHEQGSERHRALGRVRLSPSTGPDPARPPVKHRPLQDLTFDGLERQSEVRDGVLLLQEVSDENLRTGQPHSSGAADGTWAQA